MDLSTSESFEAELPEGLPKDENVRAAVQKVASDLTKLLDAPVVDAFVGPAILSGRASGVFFHEIFGHRIEGHRQKDESDQQTFTRMVNSKVLPDFLSVVFDPTKKTLAGTDLNGWYDYDDEGVKARPVKVVENGTLKTFLMSRSPIKGFSQSNGHGRKQAGLEPVSRQSNLIVESSKQVPAQQLRQMLIAEIKRQGKSHGFYFEHVTGGYTTTGRSGFQSFKVLPLVVYRIYADGRPDELVRGVDIVGTPLSSFARIMATSDKLEVFNGYCGAESGSIPVSAVSPAILVSELEIQKKEKGRDRPPLLPAPSISGGSQ
jgi:predicted Zn-dependent protease